MNFFRKLFCILIIFSSFNLLQAEKRNVEIINLTGNIMADTAVKRYIQENNISMTDVLNLYNNILSDQSDLSKISYGENSNGLIIFVDRELNTIVNIHQKTAVNGNVRLQ